MIRAALQLTAAFLLAVISVFVVACALCFLTGNARGQGTPDCPDGKCWVKPAAGQPLATVVADDTDHKFAWVQRSSDQYLLTRDGVTIGQWYVPHATYYPLNGATFTASKPPIDPPDRPRLSAEAKLLIHNGIDRENFYRGERLSFSGKPIHPGRLSEAFGGQLADDSDKGYLVIISSDPSKANKVFEDWKTLPNEFTSRFLVWRAPAGHFSMQDRFIGKPRFFTEGDPTVVLQKKDGTVLFRRPQAGQVYKTTDMQDILKSDPSYQPKLDPGGPTPVSSFSLSPQATTALSLAGAGILAFFLRRKQ